MCRSAVMLSFLVLLWMRFFFGFLYTRVCYCFFFFFFQAEDGIRDHCVTGVQTCALPISVLRVAESIRAGDGRYPALQSMLSRDLPRVRERKSGATLQTTDLEEMKARSEERRVGKECRYRCVMER